MIVKWEVNMFDYCDKLQTDNDEDNDQRDLHNPKVISNAFINLS